MHKPASYTADAEDYKVFSGRSGISGVIATILAKVAQNHEEIRRITFGAASHVLGFFGVRFNTSSSAAGVSSKFSLLAGRQTENLGR
jgi:hypothetical protein